MKTKFYIILLATVFHSCNDAPKNENQAGSEPIEQKTQENQVEELAPEKQTNEMQQNSAPWCKAVYVVYDEAGAPWFEVAESDYPSSETLEVAQRICSTFDNGWRLPINEELYAMFNQLGRQGIGNFRYGRYMSSTETEKTVPYIGPDGSIEGYRSMIYSYEFKQNLDRVYIGEYNDPDWDYYFRPVRSVVR